MEPFSLETYLSDGITALVSQIMRATLKHPRASAYFASYALSAKAAERRRHALAKQGEHIPSFLIASITGTCNLKCQGCYDRANSGCKSTNEMSQDEWWRTFQQAKEAGIAAILLAGGEPLMRLDVLEAAAGVPGILFPVFTNGTMLTDKMLAFFDAHRNLIPIISIEGNAAQTDARRGAGIYDVTMDAMQRMHQVGLLFGASITVTSPTLHDVTAPAFVQDLSLKGCKAIVFVEYVPVDHKDLALDDAQRATLDARVHALRSQQDMIIISFPGDEKESGGCLAAGRGFFHINASGGAEPCPFSPYSDTSLRHTSLRDALQSLLFMRLREDGHLMREHTGGCTLFDQAKDVQALLSIEQ